MPYCGEKYKHLIRTVDGHTPEDPCGYYCNLGNWDDWKQSMEALRAKVYSKLGELQRQGHNKGRGDVPDEVSRLYVGPADNSYAATLAIEPGVLDAFPGDADISAAISKAIETMDLYACALEKVDNGFVQLGLAAPETPGAVTPPPEGAKDDWWAWAKKIGLVVGIGTASYFLIRYMLSRRLALQRAREEEIDVTPRENWSDAA